MKERIYWIDWSKWLLIYLVVLGHNGPIPASVDNFICAFHMPAFFMISGYLHKPAPLGQSVAKNFKRLLVPAFLFSVLCWGAYTVLHLLQHVPFTTGEYICKPLLGLIRYDRPNVSPPCGVIWFLQVLFLCKILLDLLLRKAEKAVLPVCAVCLAAVWFWYEQGIDDKRYIFFLQRTCASFPFVALGYLAREKQVLQRLGGFRWLPWLLTALYLAGVAYNGRVGIVSWRFGHDVLLWFLIALSGCVGFFLFVNRIKTEG